MKIEFDSVVRQEYETQDIDDVCDVFDGRLDIDGVVFSVKRRTFDKGATEQARLQDLVDAYSGDRQPQRCVPVGATEAVRIEDQDISIMDNEARWLFKCVGAYLHVTKARYRESGTQSVQDTWTALWLFWHKATAEIERLRQVVATHE